MVRNQDSGTKEARMKLKDAEIAGKNVLVRLDLDVRLEAGHVADATRLELGLPTIRHLLGQGARHLTIIGHLGRPKLGDDPAQFRLKPVADWLKATLPGQPIAVLENLRLTRPGEEQGDLEFARRIVSLAQAQLYVFDAMASYRPHASVVQIPKLLPTVLGLHFEEELNHLGKVLDQPTRPLVFLIGGAKTDTKLPLVNRLMTSGFADEVLLGGKIPHLSEAICSPKGPCVRVAELAGDGLDVTPESAAEFANIIETAGTVVWNGPMGKYEDYKEDDKDEREKRRFGEDEEKIRNTPAWGTYRIARAMAETKAYTVAGGGDTEAALSTFGLTDKIDWVSAGGGAMLHYLTYGTLPILEAIGYR